MKSTIFSSILLLGILFFVPSIASGQTPKIETSSTPIQTSSVNEVLRVNEVERLKNEMQKLRDENYQRAVDSAENAAIHADRLINWMTGFATIFALLIAGFSLFIGGDLTRKLRELGRHTESARKNALYIATLSKQAQKKGEELQNELEGIKKKQEESKGKIQAQDKEINLLISKAQGTISDIGALRNSANFISGASYPPYTGTAPMGFPWYGSSSPSVEKCDRCGKPTNYVENMSNNIPWFSVGEKLCLNCWKEKYGNE